MKQLSLFVALCLVCSFESICLKNANSQQSVHLFTERANGDILEKLEIASDLNLSRHPVPLDALLFSLSLPVDSGLGWGIPTVIDTRGFRKAGVHTDEIVLASMVAEKVSRRSSLRFVLDTCGVGYYLDNDRMVVTTVNAARTTWLRQIAKPHPEQLQDLNPVVRREAAFAAGFWRLDFTEWTEPLVTAMTDSDRQVCFDAAFAVGQFGPEASIAIEPLLQLLRSNDLTLREVATYALARIGPRASIRLFELIDDPDPAVVLAAAKCFGQMGSAGNDHVAELIAVGVKYANNSNAWDEHEYCSICHAIGSAISAVELGDAVPQLQLLLTSDIPGTRSFAAFAVGEIGPSAVICEPELQKLLGDPSIAVRKDAAYALAKLDLPSATSTVALEAAAKDPDRIVSLWAAEALRVIKSKQRP